MELITALMELEAAAARVGHLLPDSEEGLAEVSEAWAPLVPPGCQRSRWHRFWAAWLRDCADRLPPAEAHVPVVPSQAKQGENWTCPEPY